MATTNGPKKGPAPKAKAGGFQAEALAVFSKYNTGAISAVIAATKGKGGSKLTLPEGRGYILKVAKEQPVPRDYTPPEGEGREPFPVFDWKLEVVSVPPSVDDSLVGAEITRSFWFEQKLDKTGKEVCYDGVRAAEIVEVAYGEEHTDLMVLWTKLVELGTNGTEFIVDVVPRNTGSGVNYFFQSVA